MDKLIVICKEESQANHLAFLLGIPSTSVLPYFDKKCIDLINPESVGGFVTFIKPYPNNVIELKESLRSHRIGNNLINLDFDESGNCKELKLITDGLNDMFSKYKSKNLRNSFELRSFDSDLRNLFNSFGLLSEKGFGIKVIFNANNPILKAITNSAELFLKLIFKYNNK
jgi:hypothetical protein